MINIVQMAHLLSSCLCTAFFSLTAYKVARMWFKIGIYFKPSFIFCDQDLVVVSGATDGVGKAFVQRLIKQKCQVLAIGRDIHKLQDLRREAESHIHPCLIDFSTQHDSQISPNIQQSINRICKEKKVEFKGIIHCCAMAHLSSYKATSMETINNLHKTNLGSLHTLLQNLPTNSQHDKKQSQQRLDNQKEGKSTSYLRAQPFFINVSSMTADRPSYMSSVYAATKAYSSSLISSVRQQNKEVSFMDVKPWYIRTKMIGNPPKTWDMVNPEEVTDGSLRALFKRTSVAGTWKHQLLNEFSFIANAIISQRKLKLTQRVIKLEQIQSKRKRKEKKKVEGDEAANEQQSK